ncbi:toll/interleukin-1 receptor domain-containing protein [Clostridium butyricum]|uniref:toll/interleukin-1 receptor domain-containing protein n=1 Tax=Clostridium butyricum TaxID=1492 RepID=UPI003467C64D
MVNMFVSYCQRDAVYADNIDLYFKDKGITIHRDIRDISSWKSIREYMGTIRDKDYAILVISDNYLKSFNCMYEVLEVMKEKDYENKIFPVVVETSIYSSAGRIPYIRYWQDKYKELKEQINKIDIVNAGNIIDDLKKTQNIVLSMDEFLAKVADMNNPNVSDVNKAIEDKLQENGLLNNSSISAENKSYNAQAQGNDIFSSLNIPKASARFEPTDLEKNQFMSRSFQEINNLMKEISAQVEQDNTNIQVNIEVVDSRAVIYQYYKNGNQVRFLKLSLGNWMGMKENTIGISCENYFFGNNGSYNGMISSKVEDGELRLYFSFAMSLNQGGMSVQEVVKEIWVKYVQQYLY